MQKEKYEDIVLEVLDFLRSNEGMREQAVEYLSTPKPKGGEKSGDSDIFLSQLGEMSIEEIRKLAKDF